MTIKELSKYNTIKLEINQLNKSIAELYSTILGSPILSDMPKSKNTSKSPIETLVIKKTKLEQLLQKKKNKLLDEQIKIEKFLETIEDNIIRVIIRSKYIDGKTWGQTAKELNFERTTIYYRLTKYLEERSQNEKEK